MKSRYVIAMSFLTAASAFAADPISPGNAPVPKNSKTVFLDPAEAGIEYKLQGEYVGAAGASKWGAQVIAMGDGKFHAVFEPGGLPGAGWDAKNRYESEGKLDGDKVVLVPTDKVAWDEGHFPPPVVVKKGFDATISGETLTGKTDTGERFELKKTLRHSLAEGAKPPAGASVLFDGSNVDAWKGTKVLAGGLMKEGGETKQKFTDYKLHVEFMIPFKPFARDQERGNSGVYHQHRYEIQILDSFGLKGMDNQCGGIYTKKAPDVNMCFPPLTWQTYDFEFTAARYDAQGKKLEAAVMTVIQNGVMVQDHVKMDGATGAGVKEDPKVAIQTGPLYLQDHGNPVFFRNVWIVEKK